MEEKLKEMSIEDGRPNTGYKTSGSATNITNTEQEAERNTQDLTESQRLKLPPLIVKSLVEMLSLGSSLLTHFVTRCTIIKI